MNIVSLVTFVAGLCYLNLGFVGLKSDYRARLNQIFFLLCLACAWWAFCIAFMFPASTKETAWLMLRLSSPGWCIGPALILHFTMFLTTTNYSPVKRLFTLLIYIPGIIFTVIGLTRGLTSKMVIYRNFGWDNIPASYTPEYWAYVIFYLFCVGASIAILIYWGSRSSSIREKKQARVLAISSFLGLILAGGSETLAPLIGFTHVPKIPVVMWLCWAYGMWVAISKYRFLTLTPEIASREIMASIKDMMIMLNPQGCITDINDSVETLLAWQSHELMGQPASRILGAKNSLDEPLEQIKKGILTNQKIELDYASKNGEIIPVMLSCSGVRDSFEELAGVVLVAHDLRPTRLLETQNEELEAITNDLLEANLILAQKSLQIKNILDNVGQGFLTFGPDLLIKDEYSQECILIFSRSPAGQTLAEMLYPGDQDQAAFLQTIFTRVIGTEDQDRIGLYMPLLPAEALINQRSISLAYQIVKDSTASESKYIICILTDITEKRRLEEKMEEERSSLRMVVKTIVYYDTFIECVEDFKNFSRNTINEILAGPGSLDEKITDIYRYIHTFKGDFSQFDTAQAVKQLHEAETMLSQARDAGQLSDEDSIRQFLQAFEMQAWLDADLKKISAFLGEDFLKNKDTYKIEKARLLELEDKMALLLPHKEYALLLPYIKKLTYKPFKDLLKSYPEYVLQLAERLDKSINAFSIEGDNPSVDHEYYHLFTRSLVHVFRNMVDHGIEYANERILLGKSEIGSIRCRIVDLQDQIQIIIADDGTGVDPQMIREKAVASGKYTETELAFFTDQELVNLIFEEELSTQDQVSMISGRGIGLAVVKNETERINGQIQVNSIPDRGTEYIFNLPVPEYYEMPLLSMPNIVISVIQTMQDLAVNQLDINLGREVRISSADKVALHKYTAMISIRGVIDGIVLMSFNENLIREFARILLKDEASSGLDSEVLEDLTAEATNIILGNSLKNLGEFEDLVRISIPTVTTNLTASLKKAHTDIYSCSIENDIYTFTSCFIHS